MGLLVHQNIEILILFDHVAGGDVRIVGNLDGRGKDVELRRVAPVQDQGCHHYPGSQCRFAVFLRDQQEPFGLQSAARLGVISPKHRRHQVKHPRGACFAKGGASRCVHNLELFEHREGAVGLGLEYRRGDYRLAGLQPVGPIGASGRPSRGHFLPP